MAGSRLNIYTENGGMPGIHNSQWPWWCGCEPSSFLYAPLYLTPPFTSTRKLLSWNGERWSPEPGRVC